MRFRNPCSILAALSLLSACGGGGSSQSGSPRVLQAIEVTSASSSVPAGLSDQFTATGKYSDGSRGDLTRSATWQTSNTTTATISNSGLLTSKAQGTVTVTASSAGVTGTTSLNIAPPNLVSISVAPPSVSAASGTTTQFRASGKYTDGSTSDLTSSVTWNSSNANTATIDTGGLATARAQGNATISALLGKLTGTAVLTSTAPGLVSIAVSPSAATIAFGTTQNFRAIATLTDGSTQDITGSAKWSSSALTVATVTQGLAKSVNPGTSLISAAVGTISGNATLNVTNASLTSMTISPQVASIPLGTLQQFTAAGTFSDGSTQDITDAVNWSSSANSVAAITVSGMATARNVGGVTITAQWPSTSVSSSTSLSVNTANVSSLTISPASPVIAATTSTNLVLTGLFDDGGTRNLTSQAVWTSSDTTTATVGASKGVIKGIAPGTATITATLGTLNASVVLTVTNATLVSISVTPSGRSIAAGTKQGFTATGIFNDSTSQVITSNVTWTSDNGAVASISGSNVATGVGVGVANISASFEGVTGSTPLAVTSAKLSSLKISPSSALIAPASTQGFQATGQFSDGTTQNVTGIATWSSSDTGVATVTSGLATGQSGGAATITAQVGTVSNTASLVVESSPLVSLSISSPNATIPASVTTPYTAIATFADGSTQNLTTSATWTSSPSSVVTIGDSTASNGVAKGISPGSSTITAVFAGVVGTTSLTVSDATLNSISISPNTLSVAVGASLQFTATGSFSDGSNYLLTSQVTWASSTLTVATITSGGLVTATGDGTATITATLDGVNASTTLTVP